MSKIKVGNEIHENPLAKFKSYSYYHVLAVCNSSETATALAVENRNIVDTWLHPSPSEYANDYLGPWSPKTLKTQDGKDDPLKQYCVLINGSTDASFAITRVAFQTYTAAGAVNNDRYTSLAVEGSIEISEPKGITFLDTITQCCVALGKDAAHVTFVLKTFFVGINDQDQIETIPTISPIMFVVVDATGTFTEAGGQYTLSFVAMSNGVTRLPQYDKMVKSPNLVGKTLSEVVNNLQQQVNSNYEKMYRCVVEQTAKAELALNYKPEQLVSALKKVEYRIELDPYYANSRYTFDGNTSVTKDKGECSEASKNTTGTDVSLESALHMMMQLSNRVKADGTTEKGIEAPYTMADGRVLPEHTVMQYKIHTSLETLNPSKDNSNPSYVVTYRIVPYPAPKQLLSVDASNADLLAKNTIEFDYMYTGKNIDILEFDMKVNMGLAYLQIATLSNSLKTQGEPLPPYVTIPNIGSIHEMQQRLKSDKNRDTVVDMPVFFSTKLELPMNQSTHNHADTAGSVYNMTKHSSLEVLDVNMKITGNLQLLQTSTVTTHPSLAGKQNVSMHTFDWGYIPGYARVNIMMPSNNDDIGLFGGDYKQSYAKQFWFNNYYYILGIEHVFEDGEFIQNLNMIGMPPSNTFDYAKERQTKSVEFSTTVKSCYDNEVKCEHQQSTQQQPSTQQKQDQINKSQAAQRAKTQPIPVMPPTQIDELLMGEDFSPENVNGFSESSPEVQQAIYTAANVEGLSPGTLAMMASLESAKIKSGPHKGGFDPNSKNPNSTATGLFQIVDKTWNGLSAERVPVRSGQTDPRIDPLKNAIAAAKLTREAGSKQPTAIYMNHMLGNPKYRKVMAAKGCQPMKDVLGYNDWKNIATLNGFTTIENGKKTNNPDMDMTTCEFRGIIAGRMHGRLKTKEQLAAAQAAGQQPSTPLPQSDKSPPCAEVIGSNKSMCKPGQTGDKEPETCSVDSKPDSDQKKTTRTSYGRGHSK